MFHTFGSGCIKNPCNSESDPESNPDPMSESHAQCQSQSWARSQSQALAIVMETRLPGTICPNRCDDLSRPRGPGAIPGVSILRVEIKVDAPVSTFLEKKSAHYAVTLIIVIVMYMYVYIYI